MTIHSCRATWPESYTIRLSSVNSVKKISHLSYLFWKLRDIVSVSYLRTAYFGLVQPHIFYGFIHEVPHLQFKKCYYCEKNYFRAIIHAGPIDHYRPLFRKIKILTIINLNIFQIFLYTKYIRASYTRCSVPNGNGQMIANDDEMYVYEFFKDFSTVFFVGVIVFICDGPTKSRQVWEN